MHSHRDRRGLAGGLASVAIGLEYCSGFSQPVTLSGKVSAWPFPGETTLGYVGLVPTCNFLVAATGQRRGHWLH